VTLTNGSNRYCGEPAIDVCGRCVADHGNNIDEDIMPAPLRARSAALLHAARTVVVPSQDTARRIERHFGVEVLVGTWETNMPPVPTRPALRIGARRRVCVVGAIGLEKGYETLLGAARIAAELDLPLEFTLVGYSCDDWRLLETGRVSITGRYEEAEAVRLIRAQNADFAFLPALWPETWSYVLSQIWEAGLPVLAHDVGAPAERIRANGGGIVLPLHMPAERLAELFVDPALFELLMEARADAADDLVPGLSAGNGSHRHHAEAGEWTHRSRPRRSLSGGSAMSTPSRVTSAGPG
jgi:glycosyltransferase involved in cell wall biosynthesis